jgi:hypothetical protein
LPLPLWLAAALLAAALPSALRAADADDAVRQKNAEVERLKRSLEQAEQELQQLKADNARLREQQPPPAPVPPVTPPPARELKRREQELQQLREENERLRRAQERAPKATPARESRPVRPLAGLPPLTAESVVDVDELVGHFATDPAAAAARYGKQTFRLKGEVDRFNPGLLTRQFTVLLAGPDRAYTVACRFNYIDRYKTVFTTRNGRALTARYDSGREVTLLEAGQTVVIEGRCAAAADKHGEIEFSRCELLR